MTAASRSLGCCNNRASISAGGTKKQRAGGLGLINLLRKYERTLNALCKKIGQRLRIREGDRVEGGRAYLVIDHFLNPIHDEIKPVSITNGNVSGLEPPIGRERLFIRGGVIQITLIAHRIRFVLTRVFLDTPTFITVGPRKHNSPGLPGLASTPPCPINLAWRFGERTPTDPALDKNRSRGMKWTTGDISVIPYPAQEKGVGYREKDGELVVG